MLRRTIPALRIHILLLLAALFNALAGVPLHEARHMREALRSVQVAAAAAQGAEALADAEAAAALGDLPGAIDRIQGAHQRFRRPNAADVIELSVMDARLKVWQRQQREDLRDDN